MNSAVVFDKRSAANSFVLQTPNIESAAAGLIKIKENRTDKEK